MKKNVKTEIATTAAINTTTTTNIVYNLTLPQCMPIKINVYDFDCRTGRASHDEVMYNSNAFNHAINIFAPDEINEISAFTETPVEASNYEEFVIAGQKDAARLIKALSQVPDENGEVAEIIGYVDKEDIVHRGPLMSLFLLQRPIKIKWVCNEKNREIHREAIFYKTKEKIKFLEGAKFEYFECSDGVIAAIFNGGIFPAYTTAYGEKREEKIIPADQCVIVYFA